MYILGQKLGKDMENLGSGTIPGPITITFGRREEKQKPHSSRYLVVKRGSRYDRLDGPAVQEASYDDIEVEKVLSEAEDFTEAQQLAPGKTVALQPNTRSKRVLIKRPA